LKTPSPKILSPRFAAAMCGMVAVLSLWNTVNGYRKTESGTARGDRYGVLLQQARLRGLISSLPAVNVVGYFTDPESGLVTDVDKLLGAEYAFAPRILVRQSEFPQQWVVGDFSRRIDLAGFARTHGFRIVGDFGDGIILFERNGDR
jgi:hypothetical protein